jgi:hypothetical protein
MCKGQKYIIQKSNLQPCPTCSTAEFRREWEMKEGGTSAKAKAVRTSEQCTLHGGNILDQKTFSLKYNLSERFSSPAGVADAVSEEFPRLVFGRSV